MGCQSHPMCGKRSVACGPSAIVSASRAVRPGPRGPRLDGAARRRRTLDVRRGRRLRPDGRRPGRFGPGARFAGGEATTSAGQRLGELKTESMITAAQETAPATRAARALRLVRAVGDVAAGRSALHHGVRRRTSRWAHRRWFGVAASVSHARQPGSRDPRQGVAALTEPCGALMIAPALGVSAWAIQVRNTAARATPPGCGPRARHTRCAHRRGSAPGAPAAPRS
jgi:hypothetical protein